jgi:hypothetical protein
LGFDFMGNPGIVEGNPLRPNFVVRQGGDPFAAESIDDKPPANKMIAI